MNKTTAQGSETSSSVILQQYLYHVKYSILFINYVIVLENPLHTLYKYNEFSIPGSDLQIFIFINHISFSVERLEK